MQVNESCGVGGISIRIVGEKSPLHSRQTALIVSLVVSALAVDVIDGLHTTASGRFFAWVIGGALPVALDADWLTAAWDQNAYNYVTGPAAAVVEECEPQTACGH